METLLSTGPHVVPWEAGQGKAEHLEHPSAGGGLCTTLGCETGWSTAGAPEQHSQRPRHSEWGWSPWLYGGWMELNALRVKDMSLELSAWICI